MAPMSDNFQPRVKTLIDAHGIQAAADHLNISYESAKSIYAGLPVRKGTIALVEANIDKPFANGKASKKPIKKKSAPKKKGSKK